ncbi:MAG: YhdP family protein [Woeseia sp.]
MKGFLKKLLSVLAYIAAGCIILLAIAVGLFRLFLPRLPAHQEDIKAWAAEAIGMEVDFSGMNARWRFSGPELNFYNAELKLPDDEQGAFAADEVSLGIDLMRLLLDRTFVIDSVLVRDAAVSIRKNPEGEWLIQDVPLDTLTSRFARGDGASDISVIAEDIDVAYEHPANGDLVEFTVGSLRLTRSAKRLLIDTVLALPASLGNRLSVGIVSRPAALANQRVWQYSIDTRDLNIAGWSRLLPAGWPQSSGGRANISMSIEQFGSETRSALLELEASDITIDDTTPPFGIAGRMEYQRAAGVWLVRANDFRLLTQRGSWPSTSINVQGETSADGALQALSATASYLELDDVRQLQPWLPPRFAGYLQEYQPSGRVTDASLSLSDMSADVPAYDISLNLDNAGVVPRERWPGLRGFTGSLRANPSGGRLEIGSAGLVLDLSRWLPDPVTLDEASGTVIWRRNLDGIIVLSDDIALRNADLTSNSNVQLSLPAGDGAPVLDIESRWSISDLSAARRYLPREIINPPLYSWLQSALIGGSIPTGTTRFSGAIDLFPFDNGEGVFRIEATLADARLLYSDRWPVVENLNLDLVVDRTRLYSEKNTASNAGNSVVNAKIEIADLREPVLTINSLATGTLESIRRFARQSPIADVFGGRLDQVAVTGNASFVLDLTYPIRNRDAYEFTTRVQTSGGTLQIDGLAAAVTELNGIVTIARDDISSEALFGRFLGEPVNIELRPAGDELPGYSVLAMVDGHASAAGIATTFGISLDGILDGGAAYTAELRFPRADAATPSLFSIEVRSSLEGMALQLPEPLAKPPGVTEALTAEIVFPEEGVVTTNGAIATRAAWSLAFLKGADHWDFDRGGLALGGAQPVVAETRGLHIAGNVAELHLGDWLDTKPASSAAGDGMASRIRSLDINVQNLYVLGQHFGEHQLLIDRSSNDWLVQVDGVEAQGSLAIPYDFASGRTLTAKMQKFVLPGGDDDDDAAGFSMDPRQLPPVSLQAEEFAFGDRYLGQVAAEFKSTPTGIVAEGITTRDKTFSIEGAAGWVIDTGEPLGQKTWAKARLVSSDVQETLRRLGSSPGIEGDDMEISFDVSWPGGPREDFLDGLNGEMRVRLGTGQLNEVEPGAGRVFGLMSVVALPRRLALDFRDVLDRGFLFDEITGTFRVANGNAYTCDLSLKGPAADIGIVGRAGLHTKDYSQSAVVSANVGNTLPVVGAVVAGPQVAAALLIFSRIFKKPLQEMGQAYYAIEGSWDDPEVESANAAVFADVTRAASCLQSQP